MEKLIVTLAVAAWSFGVFGADDTWKPYSPPCTERENVFEFTEKPAVKMVGQDKYEITFAVKGNCDVAVGIVDPSTSSGQGEKGIVVRHLASGVLGANAPAPFQKNSLKQTIYWNGKDDFGEYVREPGKLKVRVWLGLKPTFSRLLGWHPQELLAGPYRGIAIDQDGVYVLSGGNPQLRKFDRNGNYIKTVFPPAADLPMEKFRGMEKLEYEPGKWALHVYVGHGALPYQAEYASTVSGFGIYLPGGAVPIQQVSMTDGFFTYTGGAKEVRLFRVKAADGTSDDQSIAWRAVSRTIGRGRYTADKKLITGEYYQNGEFGGSNVRAAVSPDGKWLYLSNFNRGYSSFSSVYRLDASTREPMGKTPWMGEDGKPGSDNKHFGAPSGIDCDSQGRVYICDAVNNRIQVYLPDATHFRTIAIDSPDLVRVHPRTGTLYVIHKTREQGVSFIALSRLKSVDDPQRTAVFRVSNAVEHQPDALLTLDSWSSPARLWATRSPDHLVIFEEQEKEFKVFHDFKEDAKKSDFPHHMVGNGKMSCDAVREKLYFGGSHVFDLASGKYEGSAKFQGGDDIAFDKRGRMHVHFNPGFYMPGVARLDPALAYREVPYDYGEDRQGPWNSKWLGILPVKDQPGAKFFQDGIGVNMFGDVVVESNIYYVPRMEDSVVEMFVNQRMGCQDGHGYQDFVRRVRDMEKRGEEVYYIQRKPGWRLAGGTVWVYDSWGELRKGNIVGASAFVNGVGLDEDGSVYFAAAAPKMVGGRAFLAGKGRVIGTDKPTYHPFIGTVMKFPAAGGEIISKQGNIPMDEWPKRPPDMAGAGWGWDTTEDNEWAKGKNGDWAEGAEWLYAGAGPIVPGGCSCPNSRFYTDWFKRSFVTETYRHSIGVVDTAGNLVMHIGTYGNADSGRGPDSPVKVGGDEIAMAHVQYVAATDNYLCLCDAPNERITVLKLNYHAEESVTIEK